MCEHTYFTDDVFILILYLLFLFQMFPFSSFIDSLFLLKYIQIVCSLLGFKILHDVFF